MAQKENTPKQNAEDGNTVESRSSTIAQRATPLEKIAPRPSTSNSLQPFVDRWDRSLGRGFEALKAFLDAMPVESGMAIVVVVHLFPGNANLLPELLATRTEIPVKQISDGDVVRPNNVYVIPVDKDLELRGGRLYLTDVEGKRATNFPIDGFFRSLATDQGRRAIGIILSGSGTDGALGIKAIKDHSGVAIVQDVEFGKV